MIAQAWKEGVKKVRIHILLDGRDVGSQSALDYVLPFEAFLAGFCAQGADYRIASGGGRQYITMDRYGANWDMVKRGWDCHVRGMEGNLPQQKKQFVRIGKKTQASSIKISQNLL